MATDLVLRKVVKKADIETRLHIPTSSLASLPNFHGNNRNVDFEAVDMNDGRIWRFTCRKRAGAYLKPVVSGEWLTLVCHKGIQMGDVVTILRRLDPNIDHGYYQYQIALQRKITILGVAVWVTI